MSPQVFSGTGIESTRLKFVQGSRSDLRPAIHNMQESDTMSALTLWTRNDPFAEFDALVRRTFGPTSTRPTGLTRTAGFTPAAEITRDGQDALVRVELPGLDPAKDVTVEIDGGQLVVRGERRDERTEEQNGRSLREVRYGSFRRSFRLPAHVTDEAISASYDAGVLTVRITGAYQDRQPRRIEVTASPAQASTDQSA
jgi:HSP20 family protein